MKTIMLTQGYETQVCDCHYDLVKDFKWTLFTNKAGRYFYAYRKNGKQTILMHKMLLVVPKGDEVDHIDRNGLNNQCSNLRHATSSQNHMNHGLQRNNTSGHPGVRWRGNRWQAEIKRDGKSTVLGRFMDIDDAIRVREAAEKEYFGDFLNRTS